MILCVSVCLYSICPLVDMDISGVCVCLCVCVCACVCFCLSLSHMARGLVDRFRGGAGLFSPPGQTSWKLKPRSPGFQGTTPHTAKGRLARGPEREVRLRR